MVSKYFTFFAAVAVSVSTAFGQVSTTPEKSSLNSGQAAQLQYEQLPNIQHAPMRRAVVAPRIDNGAVSTYNWGGYAVTGTDFTNVTGSWKAPTVNCAESPNAVVAVWVGIDGYSSSTVEQIGVSAVCEHKTPVYYAWYEFYPNGSVEISSITVAAGDKFTGEVSYSSSTKEFAATLTNVTTGATYKTSQAVSGAARSSAEWIVEAPEASGVGILNLADFGKVYLGDDYTSETGTNEATDSTVSGAINKFGTGVQKITQIDWLLYTEQTPSVLSSDGSSFYTTWIEYN
jgi:Peptidase A4 family